MKSAKNTVSNGCAEVKTVQVLLATFNGGKYLGEFLESLKAQKGVNIELLVSDDGSSDDTVSILNSYSKAFAKLTLLSGPRKGPSKNFIFLLKNAKGKFIALADQDDVWLPEKLINAVDELSHFAEPTLRISFMLEMGKRNIIRPEIWTFPVDFLVNQSHGCSFVMNASLLHILQSRNCEEAIMHDWFILLLAKYFGKVIINPAPDTLYRIHADNFIGRPDTFTQMRNSLNIKRNRAQNLIRGKQMLTIFNLESNIHTPVKDFKTKKMQEIFSDKLSTRLSLAMRIILNGPVKLRVVYAAFLILLGNFR